MPCCRLTVCLGSQRVEYRVSMTSLDMASAGSHVRMFAIWTKEGTYVLFPLGPPGALGTGDTFAAGLQDVVSRLRPAARPRRVLLSGIETRSSLTFAPFFLIKGRMTCPATRRTGSKQTTKVSLKKPLVSSIGLFVLHLSSRITHNVSNNHSARGIRLSPSRRLSAKKIPVDP